MSDYQEEVLTELIDLQAELRGDEPPVHEPKAVDADAVTVSEHEVAVSATPTTTIPVNERLQALNERLSRLEFELAGVTKRIERIEPEELESDGPSGPDADPDAPWRSFIDLQRIVADRLEQR